MTSRPASLEEALRAENPKGRLYELCAGAGLERPEMVSGQVGPRHRAMCIVRLRDREVDSGVHWAPARRTAEQLAARALLETLGDELGTANRRGVDVGDEDVFEIGPDEAERLRGENPKGRLFEWCQGHRPPLRRPRFEVRALPGAVLLVRARLDAMELTTPWFRGPRRSDAEQGASEALLEYVAPL